jgi:hypothetical protein
MRVYEDWLLSLTALVFGGLIGQLMLLAAFAVLILESGRPAQWIAVFFALEFIIVAAVVARILGMKSFVMVITATILTSLCWFAFIRSSQKVERLRNDMMVEKPMSSMIGDIQETSERGEADKARAKLKRLRQNWDEYRRGGKLPIDFENEVYYPENEP